MVEYFDQSPDTADLFLLNLFFSKVLKMWILFDIRFFKYSILDSIFAPL